MYIYLVEFTYPLLYRKRENSVVERKYVVIAQNAEEAVMLTKFEGLSPNRAAAMLLGDSLSDKEQIVMEGV